MTTIIILCVVGILCILAELVLPGGVLGVAGAISLIVAVAMAFVNYGATAGTFALLVMTIFGIATLAWWMKNFHRLPVVKNLILNEEVGDDEEIKRRQSLVGQIGIALTDLHPSGPARFGDDRFDVMAEGPEIEKGASVKIVSARGPSIFVREV